MNPQERKLPIQDDEVQEIYINKKNIPEPEYEEDDEENDDEPIFIREKSTHNYSRWFWILGVLLFIAFVMFGYTKGWFNTLEKTTSEQKENRSTLDSETRPFMPVPKNAASLDSFSIETKESFPVQKTLVLKGNLAHCTYLQEPKQERDGNLFMITLETRAEESCDIASTIPFEKRVELMINNLPAGSYSVRINGQHETRFDLEGDNRIDFEGGEIK